MSVNLRNFFRQLSVAYLLLGLVLVASLLSCRAENLDRAGSWKTYRNQRFGFEFLYPDRWVSSNPPENRDGIAFSDPSNPDVEIRGWAGTELGGKNSVPANFTTQQGIAGNLEIKLDAKVSSMTMTIVQSNIRYNWRGSSPSQQFDSYYQFFYYIASRFKISS